MGPPAVYLIYVFTSDVDFAASLAEDRRQGFPFILDACKRVQK